MPTATHRIEKGRPESTPDIKLPNAINLSCKIITEDESVYYLRVLNSVPLFNIAITDMK